MKIIKFILIVTLLLCEAWQFSNAQATARTRRQRFLTTTTTTTTEAPIYDENITSDGVFDKIDSLIDNTIDETDKIVNRVIKTISNTIDELIKQINKILPKGGILLKPVISVVRTLVTNLVNLLKNISIQLTKALKNPIMTALQEVEDLLLNTIEPVILQVEKLHQCDAEKTDKPVKRILTSFTTCIPEILYDSKDINTLLNRVDTFANKSIATPSEIVKCLRSGIIGAVPCLIKVVMNITSSFGKLLKDIAVDGALIAQNYVKSGAEIVQCLTEASGSILTVFNEVGIKAEECLADSGNIGDLMVGNINENSLDDQVVDDARLDNLLNGDSFSYLDFKEMFRR